jgi:integrase
MKRKINKTLVENLTPPDEGSYFCWDTELTGFGIRITRNEIKTFVLKITVDGKRPLQKIGVYPGVTVEVARTEAKRRIGVVASGGNPVTDRSREKLKAVTVEQCFRDYFRLRDLKPSTIHGMEIELENTFGKWKKKPLTQITRQMVQNCYLERCERSKSRANAAMRYLRAVFNLAIYEYRDVNDTPIINSNPVDVLSQLKLWRKVERRKSVLTPSDLKKWVPAATRLGEVPSRAAGTGKKYPKLRNGAVHGDIFLFAAMTGARKSEILGLKKHDVDFEKKTVVFRATKNRTNHELPLTDTLILMLQTRVNANNTPFVFASPHDGAVPSNFRSSYGRILDQTGLTFTCHDLRRLAASSMERLGVPHYTIKAILNHKTGAHDVTGGYIQVDYDMMLQALKKLEAFINNHMKTVCNRDLTQSGIT